MQNLQTTIKALSEAVENDEFNLDPKDFFSARESGGSAVTHIAQLAASMADAAQVLNTSIPEQREQGGGYTSVISPVVMPKDSRSYLWIVWALMLAMIGIVGMMLPVVGGAFGLFGVHYWLLWLIFVVFNYLWKNTFVMIPDGCQALIMKYGKLEEVVGPGRKVLLHPLRKVGYIVNTAKEYPYNAPIRQAPTQGRVDASVDLFLQFRIENPTDFIFTLGGATGFEEKLHNAISEVTRALIYEQKAEDIYDLVGENTQSMLDSLNRQFLPAVRFVNANITHAEPSSQEYRMDLAAAEVIRVAKEAYTYQYELSLRKEQDEGELNKELASLRETLSEIKAEIATYQAQINTAKEKAINRANAYARQLLIEAESEAKANAAMLQAQALDIKALNSALYPEILEYRFRQETLKRVASVAEKLPQIISIGSDGDKNQVDFMAIAQEMLGVKDVTLYTPKDMQSIRERRGQIVNRIKERSKQIKDSESLQALPAKTGDVIAEARERAKQVDDLVGETIMDEPPADEGGE